jgi:putative ABC transport system permease protein
MNVLSLIRVSLRALLRNKMRSALTMLGIVIGVGAVITMVAITTGARNSVQAQISSLGDNVFMIFSSSFNQGGSRQAAGSRSNLTTDDVDALGTQCPDVRAVTPAIRTNGQLVYADQNWATSVWGVAPSYTSIRSYYVANGRDLTDSDLRGQGVPGRPNGGGQSVSGH